MPVMLREFQSPKAQQLADQVMELAQRYGSDVGQMDMSTLKNDHGKGKSTLKNNHMKAKQEKFEPVGDFGSFVGSQTGK
ncbi:MAG: hypothetical protein K940chlam3_00109 [Chlamydiae bacterium]|nr:hypothetical protein [Chlamydiota bacterium]